jgi:hypothetical protein
VAPATADASARYRIDGVVRERERLIAVIATMRGELATSTPFLDKAEVMMTRLWARAPWTRREQLLKNVYWLIRLEQQNAGVRRSA